MATSQDKDWEGFKAMLAGIMERQRGIDGKEEDGGKGYQISRRHWMAPAVERYNKSNAEGQKSIV